MIIVFLSGAQVSPPILVQDLDKVPATAKPALIKSGLVTARTDSDQDRDGDWDGRDHC